MIKSDKMKVVILCGGLGTRLKEETQFRPKPMVNIGDKPILWHVMKIYAHYGFKDFVLALGYKGEMIREYFQNKNHKEIDWQVTFVDTGEQTLKGARLKRIEKYIDGEEFMVTYGDGVGNINIPTLLRFHQNHGKIATVTATVLQLQFGELVIQKNNTAKFTEKPISKSFINSGFFVFNKAIFKYLTDKDSCDLEYEVLEKLSRNGHLKAYKHKGFWRWMDTFRDMEYLNDLWKKGEARWKVW